MNKKTLVFTLGLLFVIVAALSYVFISQNSKEPRDTAKSPSQNNRAEQTLENTTPNNDTPGKYTVFSSEELTSAKGSILLFFHAPWCPQCREIEKTIYEDGVPKNVTVLKVDYDTNQALRQKYSVTLQTTFVKVNNQGDEIASYVAYDEPSFDAVKRELLP